MLTRLAVFAVTLVAALVLAAPGVADHGGVCVVSNDPQQPGKSEFAKEHIVPLASDVLGQGHKPGHHKGNSECAHEQNKP